MTLSERIEGRKRSLRLPREPASLWAVDTLPTAGEAGQNGEVETTQGLGFSHVVYDRTSQTFIIGGSIQLPLTPEQQALLAPMLGNKQAEGERTSLGPILPALTPLEESKRRMRFREMEPTEIPPEEVYLHRDFNYFPERSYVISSEGQHQLTLVENRVLGKLARQPNIPVNYRDLVAIAWPEKVYTPSRQQALKTHFSHLRRKLGDDSEKGIIESVYNVGYLLRDPDRVVERQLIEVEAKPEAERIFRHSAFVLNLDQHTVTPTNEQEIHLTPLEFHLFESLCLGVNRIVSYDFLIDMAWGMDSDIGSVPSLKTHISSIRGKIGNVGKLLQVKDRVGYRLIDPETFGKKKGRVEPEEKK